MNGVEKRFLAIQANNSHACIVQMYSAKTQIVSNDIVKLNLDFLKKIQNNSSEKEGC